MCSEVNLLLWLIRITMNERLSMWCILMWLYVVHRASFCLDVNVVLCSVVGGRGASLHLTSMLYCDSLIVFCLESWLYIHHSCLLVLVLLLFTRNPDSLYMHRIIARFCVIMSVFVRIINSVLYLFWYNLLHSALHARPIAVYRRVSIHGYYSTEYYYCNYNMQTRLLLFFSAHAWLSADSREQL